MNFVGVICRKDSFEKIKNYFKNKDTKLIHINNNSIDNIKNIKFEAIVIDEDLNKLNNEINTINKLCKKIKYLIINTDINLKFDLLITKKINIITYGLNQKATVTLSSRTESSMLIYLQRNVKTSNNDEIEVGEQRIKINEDSKLSLYDILIIYIIKRVNENSIIDEI